MSGPGQFAPQTREYDRMTPEATSPQQSGSPAERPNLKKLLLSCLINLIVPIGGYFAIHPFVSNDTLALGIVLAIPVLRTLYVMMFKHRVDPIGVLAVVGFGAAVILSLFYGGSSTPIKFNEAMITGIIGIACFVSIGMGKPLHLMMVTAGGKKLEDLPPKAITVSRTVTALIGITCLAHAAVHVVFALTMSTGDFLIYSRTVGWGVILLGGAVVYWYVHGKRTPEDQAQAAGEGQPTTHRR
ncbi:VC0807 family protein [Streptomyces odontomachi]|uniref:VC0807 family protein n=1 Tax=Streptomyces odontomachi TaxID=2944940 RepID=UPI00210D2AE6|nr:VC0807 family protein [Streptomyces sp. ODS25]